MGTHQNSQMVPVPSLLVRLPSWPRVFFGNLRDLILPPHLPRLELSSDPAPFWPDVFVKRGLPWLGFVQSGVCHFFGFALLMVVVRFVALVPQPVPRPVFEHSQAIYYSASEYLPPLDTHTPDQAPPKKADPEFSPQPVISVPREADNHSQTVVAPPSVKLKHNLALPNIVAWSDTRQRPRLAVPEAPLTLAADVTRIAPRMKESVVAPPPDAAHLAHGREQPSLQISVVDPPPDINPSRTAAFEAPQPAVVAPPPLVENAPARALGELNIGHSVVIAPAPQLPTGEQRAIPAGRSPAEVAAQVVPPPPAFSTAGSAGVGSPGRVIALSLHPAVAAPPDPPPGNRRGSFAATPEGHPGASGTPGSSTPGSSSAEAGAGSRSGRNKSGSGPNGKDANAIPAGLYVGPISARTLPVGGDPAAKSATVVNPNLVASLPRPRVSSRPARPMQPETATKLSEAERAVFGGRRFYSLTLNMPNLNSAAGSWIVRFAELDHDTKPDANPPGGDLSEPSAIRKVDPGYPLQLIRENVSGTVILYAVIHADGTVGNVRVLRGVDERLDQFATQAVLQWRFQPATKNGVPVDVEATFQIPFRPPKTGF